MPATSSALSCWHAQIKYAGGSVVVGGRCLVPAGCPPEQLFQDCEGARGMMYFQDCATVAKPKVPTNCTDTPKAQSSVGLACHPVACQLAGVINQVWRDRYFARWGCNAQFRVLVSIRDTLRVPSPEDNHYLLPA